MRADNNTTYRLARTDTRCVSPGICDTGEKHLLVTEYAKGGSLRKLISDPDTLDRLPGLRANIAVQIARGMYYLHLKDIVHLDLKPDNLLMAKEVDQLHTVDQLHIQICDFGLAKATSELVPETPVNSRASSRSMPQDTVRADSTATSEDPAKKSRPRRDTVVRARSKRAMYAKNQNRNMSSDLGIDLSEAQSAVADFARWDDNWEKGLNTPKAGGLTKREGGVSPVYGPPEVLSDEKQESHPSYPMAW